MILYTANRCSKIVKWIRSFCCLKLYSGLPRTVFQTQATSLPWPTRLCVINSFWLSNLISYHSLPHHVNNRPSWPLCCLSSRPSLFPRSGPSQFLFPLQQHSPPRFSRSRLLLPRSQFQHCSYREAFPDCLQTLVLYPSLNAIILLFPSRLFSLSEVIYYLFVFGAFLHH